MSGVRFLHARRSGQPLFLDRRAWILHTPAHCNLQNRQKRTIEFGFQAPRGEVRTQFREWSRTMSSRTVRLLALCGFLVAGLLITGVALHAHHAVAGIYDLNKEMVLDGVLKKLNFTNPHASIELTVTEKDGKA